MTAEKTRFVLCGFGNVGSQIARHLAAEPDGDLEIAAVSARDKAAAVDRVRAAGLSAPIIDAADAPKYASVIVECATYASFRAVVEPALRAGRHVVAISVGALSANLDLIDVARENGATIQLASGTMPGLDLLRAAREKEVRSVSLQTNLLPQSLANEPYIAAHNIDLADAENEPLLIFKGRARDAAAAFPRHINVVVSLSLAGVGLDDTEIAIYANAKLPGARHDLTIDAETIQLQLSSQNFPSPGAKKTSRIVALSIIAALRELNAPLRIGS